MATLRAVAAGDSKERRTSAARLATKRASTQLGTWRTFVRANMKADGSGEFGIERRTKLPGEPEQIERYTFRFNPERYPLALAIQKESYP